ncbi:hypothetical protein [Streptomyces sp. NBC_01320]|uniref:hypothetical protein n=1 Tax=Streptomyces sp. NBC_01320 TaxID=2903824 RepID=UPI003FA3809C
MQSGGAERGCSAVELRDGDPARYGGQGVTKAVGHVNGEITDALTGRSYADFEYAADSGAQFSAAA